MSKDAKNQISHRSKALELLRSFFEHHPEVLQPVAPAAATAQAAAAAQSSSAAPSSKTQ